VLLLDTHVCLWSAEGDRRRLGPRTRQLLRRAESRDAVRVSPITVFELTALHTQGRLRLGRTVQQWVDQYMSQPGVRFAELSAAVAIDAGAIPRAALADPVDRLLIATARQHDATLVTCDEQILGYAAQTGSVHVHNGRQ
jgi:PIN domain nuclease of toxin-antitoxin system